MPTGKPARPDRVRCGSRCGDVVERVVTKMQEISASSSKVGEIITLIEGIAFQTNILRSTRR